MNDCDHLQCMILKEVNKGVRYETWEVKLIRDTYLAELIRATNTGTLFNQNIYFELAFILHRTCWGIKVKTMKIFGIW